MSLFEQYTVREVMCAILAVEEILNEVDFWLDLAEKDDGLRVRDCFELVDRQGVYPMEVGGNLFDNLHEALEDIPTYLEDALYADLEDREDEGVEIPDNDSVRMALIFLESVYCQDLLRKITPDFYRDLKDRFYGKNGENMERFVNLFTNGELAHYGYVGNLGQSVDALGYLVDKAIAMKIMETQSAYDVVEYGGAICEVYVDNGDICDFEEDMQMGTLFECDGVYAFNTYRDLIDGQKELIRDDFGDLGLFDDEGNWEFYLTGKELHYIGMSEELSMQKLIQAAEMRTSEVGERGKVEHGFEL